MTERLLTTAEAKARLGCGSTHLWALLRDGKIEAVKIGSKTMPLETSVQAYIDSLPRFQSKAVKAA